MTDNGLQTFALHAEDAPTLEAISDEVAASSSGPPVELGKLDPETAARQYLVQLIASPSVPAIGGNDAKMSEYRTIGTETVPLTGTIIVKFAQYIDGIAVYGSLVSIELDERNSMLSINTALGSLADIDSIATLSPADAQKVVIKDAGKEALPLSSPPKLYWYFDNVDTGMWRLVYMAKGIQRHRRSGSVGQPETLPEIFDYVVDAHSGELVAKLPRAMSVTWTPHEVDLTDDLGQTRTIRAETDDAGNIQFVDSERNIATFDFEFRQIEFQRQLLPGTQVVNPPVPANPAAVSAHANAQEVADYLFNILRRNGLDGAGGPYISSINCRSIKDPAPQQWRNAAWYGAQMVYGQRMVNGQLRSYAVALDVVAHEMTHGLNDHTAQMQYKGETGALNESYSDIFGIIISNTHQTDIDHWNWEIGEDLDGTGIPLRDLSDPTRRGQPADTAHFITTASDNGGVHANSGIHNKAAFNLITAKNGGQLVFTPDEVASLFYLSLTQRLSRTARFTDSRQAVELSAKTLFRQDADATKEKKLEAIADAFNAVGITTSP